MTENVDVVGSVLKQNALTIEKQEASSMATVGYVISALNLAWGFIYIYTLGVTPISVTQVLFSLLLITLSFKIARYSREAGIWLFSLVSTILGLRFLGLISSDGFSIFSFILTFIVTVLILGKLYPGLAALKFIAGNSHRKPDIIAHAAGIIGIFLLIGLNA